MKFTCNIKYMFLSVNVYYSLHNMTYVEQFIKMIDAIKSMINISTYNINTL